LKPILFRRSNFWNIATIFSSLELKQQQAHCGGEFYVCCIIPEHKGNFMKKFIKRSVSYSTVKQKFWLPFWKSFRMFSDGRKSLTNNGQNTVIIWPAFSDYVKVLNILTILSFHWKLWFPVDRRQEEVGKFFPLIMESKVSGRISLLFKILYRCRFCICAISILFTLHGHSSKWQKRFWSEFINIDTFQAESKNKRNE